MEKTYLPIKCREAIYTSFISCNFNFFPVICHFWSKKNENKQLNYRLDIQFILAKAMNNKIHISKRGNENSTLKYVYKDYKSDLDQNTLLKKNAKVSLLVCRMRQIAKEVLNILKNQIPSYLSGLVEKKHVSYNLHYSNTAKTSSTSNVSYGQKVLHMKVHGFGMYSQMILE